jgi:outer membrane protein TolC
MTRHNDAGSPRETAVVDDLPMTKTPTRPARARALRTSCVLVLVLMLAGCAGFSADGGLERVGELARERTGHAPRVLRGADDAGLLQTRSDELLGAPLSVDAAIELALLRHAGLQAALRELGVAEADLVQAGRLRNPVFSFLNVANPHAYKIERSVVFDLLGLLTMPQRVALERARFEEAQLRAAAEAVATAGRARRAWIAAVASAQALAGAQQLAESAQVAAELARRMARAGNVSRLARMREQTIELEARALLARARQQASADRERLVRAIGLEAGRERLVLPAGLPALPAQPVDDDDAQRLAMARRLDLQIARREVATLDAALALEVSTRFVDGVELGYANLSEGHDGRRNGYAVGVPLPLLDDGSARVARARARHEQARLRLAQAEGDARSQVREAHAAWHSAWELARHHREEVVPLAREIAEEALLRYNGMLIGTLELLVDVRAQLRSEIEAVQALRDFWLADADLRDALSTGAPGAGATTATPRALASPPATPRSGAAIH